MRFKCSAFFLLAACLGISGCIQHANTPHDVAQPIPHLVQQDGRHALLVDGEPYLVLAAQTNNSANYTAALKDVWPIVDKLHANTLVIPVAWEQVEAVEGQFDFSFVDTLLAQAREQDKRLVLLWFATWKNNGPAYAPEWVKLNNQRFPRVKSREGKLLGSLSPHFRTTLEADKRAFTALMTHLKHNDPQRTVIMVQVENEVGTYGSARDFSATAEAVFQQPVPEQLLTDVQRAPGNWQQVFGQDADEFFHAWHIGRYVNEIATAGKAAYNLPLYVNVALRNPYSPGKPGQYSSGGATDNVLHIWKSAAPAIDLIAPDIYFRDHKTVTKVLDLYNRPDNALYVAEIGNDQPYARYLFDTLGHGGIGFAPFGMDDTDYTNYPLGAPAMNDDTLAPFAELYRLFGPMAREWADISFRHKTWGVSEPVDTVDASKKIWNAQASDNPESTSDDYTQHIDLGKWTAEVSYGRPMFYIDPPTGNQPASGGAVIADLGNDEYLVTGLRARVSFYPSRDLHGEQFMMARVEEGHFKDGQWVFDRVWNGDQTDWGLNFTSRPHVLKVKLVTYKVD